VPGANNADAHGVGPVVPGALEPFHPMIGLVLATSRVTPKAEEIKRCLDGEATSGGRSGRFVSSSWSTGFHGLPQAAAATLLAWWPPAAQMTRANEFKLGIHLRQCCSLFELPSHFTPTTRHRPPSALNPSNFLISLPLSTSLISPVCLFPNPTDQLGPLVSPA
jgi:hypothetical protein